MAGDLVKLIEIKDGPLNFRVTINGEKFLLPFGGIFRVSDKIKTVMKKAKPYPLISKDFVEEYKDQFKKIKKDGGK